jgi:predicted RecB family endonuclease
MFWSTASAFAPVGLALRESGSRRVVSTLRDAAAVLLEDWPDDDGEEYVIAVKACADAITGKVTIAAFRQAFLKAALEAGIATFSVVTGNAA